MSSIAVRLLAAGVVVLTVLSALGARAGGNTGDPLLLGMPNDAGTGNTSLSTKSSGAALTVTQNGKGTAAAFNGDVAVNGSCVGCLGQPGFASSPLPPSSPPSTPATTWASTSRPPSAPTGWD